MPTGKETWVVSVHGGIAQLGEHLLCKQGVVGSIPSASTNLQWEAFDAHESDV